MPLVYDPETGIPSYAFNDAIELEEGVTPEPVKMPDTKAGIFAGDPPPQKLSGYVAENKGPTEAKVEPATSKPEDFQIGRPTVFVDPATIAAAKPDKLDAYIATDSEIAALKDMVLNQSIKDWPLIGRLLGKIEALQVELRAAQLRSGKT
jgi:hypothetical protein